MKTVIIGLGSNVGDRRQTIKQAIHLLSENPMIEIEKISSFLKVAINKIDIKRVIEKSSLKFMKRNQKLFGERVTKTNKNFNHSNFIRKGGFGDGEKKFNSTIANIYKAELNSLQSLMKKNNLRL